LIGGRPRAPQAYRRSSFGLDRTGGYTIHPDIEWGPFDGTLRERPITPDLAAIVVRDAVEAVRRDDTMLTMLPGYLLSRQCCAAACHHVPSAVQIGIDDGIPALYGKIDSRLRKLPARAVDEAVDAVMRLPRPKSEQRL